MAVGVAGAAELLGVSAARVRALIEEGHLPADKVSGIWLIDPVDLPAARRGRRPLSPRVAKALIALLDSPAMGAADLDLVPQEVSRLRHRFADLLAADSPAELLRAWLAAVRPPVQRFHAAPADLPDLAADPRLRASGISDPRANLAAVSEIEAWVAHDDLPDLVDDFMLSSSGFPNVHLRVAADPLPDRLPVGWVLADLADHVSPRESAAVRRLLAEQARSWSAQGLLRDGKIARRSRPSGHHVPAAAVDRARVHQPT